MKSLLIGTTMIPSKHRFQHMLVTGGTGEGKTNLLTGCYRKDVQGGYSIIFYDSSGSEARKAYSFSDMKRTIYCSLKTPQSLNPLLLPYPEAVVSQNIIDTIDQTVNAPTGQFLTPAMRDILRHYIHLEVKKKHPSLKNVLQSIIEHFQGKKGDDVQTAFRIAHRISEFLSDSRFNEIVCGPNAIIWEQFIEDGRILILDCHQMTEPQMRLTGNIVSKSITTYFMHTERKEFSPLVTYMDEFQDFTNQNLLRVLRQARKFNIAAILAHQDHGTIHRSPMFKELLHSILANVGTVVVFRSGFQETNVFSKVFSTINYQQLRNLPRYHAAIRTVDFKGDVVERIVKPFKLPKVKLIEPKYDRPIQLGWEWQ